MQAIDAGSPVLIVSGSIRLAPLVQRLGIPDRINYLDPLRLGPWDRHASTACFDLLAANHGLRVEEGVADAVYDTIGLGIPHHVQSFFARLREFAVMNNRERVTVADVATVYRTVLLGPAGKNDLVRYQTRLKEALDADEGFRFPSRLLRDWWSARFRGHHVPLEQRALTATTPEADR